MLTHLRLFVFVFLFSFVQLAPPARSCAPAFRKGASVRIASESALILWDASSKTEHFIRRGTFNASTPDFGFLVPTPSEPELHEADDNVFTVLEELTKPEEIIRHVTVPAGRGAKTAVGMAPAGPAEVTVLGEQRVAGFDAVKLEASDSKALLDWLKKHGYESRPALETWLERYVKDGWVITAFKIAKVTPGPAPVMPGGPPGVPTTSPTVSTRALRMTFKTARPFYPYREPEDMRKPGRHPGRFLRVFVLADARVDATLGEKGRPWVGKPVWADVIPDEQRHQLVADRLNIATEKSPSQWLTVFEDSSSPRPGEEEVFFARATVQGMLKRPPIERIVYSPAAGGVGLAGTTRGNVPEELMALSLLTGGAVFLVLLALSLWFVTACRRESRA